MNLEIETLPAVTLENKNILKFTDLRLLGLYTFVTMMIQTETTKLHAVIERVKQQFGVSDDTVIEMLKHINTLGFLQVTQNNHD